MESQMKERREDVIRTVCRPRTLRRNTSTKAPRSQVHLRFVQCSGYLIIDSTVPASYDKGSIAYLEHWSEEMFSSSSAPCCMSANDMVGNLIGMCRCPFRTSSLETGSQHSSKLCRHSERFILGFAPSQTYLKVLCGCVYI